MDRASVLSQLLAPAALLLKTPALSGAALGLVSDPGGLLVLAS